MKCYIYVANPYVVMNFQGQPPDKMGEKKIDHKIADKAGGERFSLRFKLALLLGVISFLVYANTLRNDFALDDYMVIPENHFVSKGVSGIPLILATPYHRGFINIQASNDLYRPFSLVVFATAYQFFGANPAVYHFLNIFFFAGCVIMLFLFIDKLFERKKTAVAFIAALLFALHPIHTEVVANCKSLDELLCFFFAFLSLNGFINYFEGGRVTQFMLGAFFFLLSFLAKETAITFLAIVPFIFFLYHSENKRRGGLITAAVVLISCIIIATRFWILGRYNANVSGIGFIDNPLAQKGLSFESRIATAILILGYYLRLLLVPYPLICDYSWNSIPFTHFSDPYVLISLAVFLFLVFFAARRLLIHRKDGYGFGIVFFLVTIALFSNIFFLIGDNMAERFMFFPSVGFCLVLALLIGNWIGPAETTVDVLKHKKGLAIIIPAALVYAAISINRNGDWKDNYTLYKADIEKAPGSSRLCFFLGNEMVNKSVGGETVTTDKKQMLMEGIGYMEKAVEIYPYYVEAHTELGNAYSLAGKYDAAEREEKLALRLNPLDIDAADKLGSVYLIRKQYTDGIALYKEVLAKAPDNVFAHFNLASCYANNHDYEPALAEFKKTIELDPAAEHQKAFAYIARIYQILGKMDSAKMYEAMGKEYSGPR
jgi:protein O-mannosyl-transferase